MDKWIPLIVSVVTSLVGVAVVFGSLRGQVAEHRTRLDEVRTLMTTVKSEIRESVVELKTEVRDLRQALLRVEAHEAKMTALERDIVRLSESLAGMRRNGSDR